MELDEVTVENLVDYVNRIDTHKSSGLDYTNSQVLKDLLLMTIPYVKEMVDNSLKHGIFPRKWAKGTIIPIPKTGRPDDLSNWRPITLLPAIGKVVERSVHSHIMNYLLTTRQLSDHPYGFTPGRATAEAVHELTHRINKNMNAGCLTSCTYIDMRKVFDPVSVSSQRSCEKIGLKRGTLQWMGSYLGNRSHSRLTNGQTSDFITELKGVGDVRINL